MSKYKCPCCGYYTFELKPDNTFEICPVCFWEADGVQLSKPYSNNGANRVSLLEAKRNFRQFGVIELRFMKYVRKPQEDELAGIEWELPKEL